MKVTKPKRLTRDYWWQGVLYTPKTPARQVPKVIWEREEQLATPAEQLKIARRFGTAASLPVKDLIPDQKDEPAIEEVSDADTDFEEVE